MVVDISIGMHTYIALTGISKVHKHTTHTHTHTHIHTHTMQLRCIMHPEAKGLNHSLFGGGGDLCRCQTDG